MITVNTTVVFRDEAELGAILFHVTNGDTIGLNQIGKLIWQGVADGLSKEAICARIRRECIEIPAAVEQDVEEVIQVLLRRGFLQKA